MRPRREIQEINAGSMADIAFLLLIFFLVTTTMDTDKGLLRVLPPDTNDSPPEIHTRNVLNILINRSDQILVNTEQLRVQDIRQKTVEFLLNETNSENLPEKRLKYIPPIGDVMVTKGVISLKTHRGTSYNTFVRVLNEITAGGNEVKNMASLKYFSKEFEELSKAEKEVINDVAPAVISESEPDKIN